MTYPTFTQYPPPMPGMGAEWEMEVNGEDGGKLHIVILTAGGRARIQCLYSHNGVCSAFVLTPDEARAPADQLELVADLAR